jgi:hypothetical protein
MLLDGWEIDVGALPGGSTGRGTGEPTEVIYRAPDGGRAAVVYSIFEFRMSYYQGRLAVFEDQERPRIVYNPGFSVVHRWPGDACPTVVWLTSGILVVQKFPFGWVGLAPLALVDLDRRRYAMAPSEWTIPDEISYCQGIVSATVVPKLSDPVYKPHPDRYSCQLDRLPWDDLNRL